MPVVIVGEKVTKVFSCDIRNVIGVEELPVTFKGVLLVASVFRLRR
jgi:hypothetical protein